MSLNGFSSGDRAVGGAVTLRPATDADYPFLRYLYGSTRAEEMKHFPFNDEEKAAFLDQQFAAQYEHYRVHYPTCERNIIERDGRSIGRLWIDEWRDQIRLVDIALLPEARGTGIGTRLLRDVLARGAAAGKPVTIHVEGFNPALRLYERLGFQHVDTNGVYFLMKWTPR
ncbi:MAG TPA: GNAT family N-acetyltransferase [Thermoanaerobaculia bacterium]|nr:GNAT family N-acetyltransferase [Thermoanaerobaculia bacterium]